jgi:hypothetical protein
MALLVVASLVLVPHGDVYYYIVVTQALADPHYRSGRYPHRHCLDRRHTSSFQSCPSRIRTVRRYRLHDDDHRAEDPWAIRSLRSSAYGRRRHRRFPPANSYPHCHHHRRNRVATQKRANETETNPWTTRMAGVTRHPSGLLSWKGETPNLAGTDREQHPPSTTC